MMTAPFTGSISWDPTGKPSVTVTGSVNITIEPGEIMWLVWWGNRYELAVQVAARTARDAAWAYKRLGRHQRISWTPGSRLHVVPFSAVAVFAHSEDCEKLQEVPWGKVDSTGRHAP